MKLISMHVDNFGGLHNYDYTFGEGLNVVLHDNGWGKTTMATFLKAMLYGYDTRRSKDITENERKRYLPWQGGKYGGSLDFESEGVRYRITRTFGETPRFDTVKIINLDTRTTARISPDKIGETLFHLDANAFQRSVFINQNGLSIDGAASSIHTRLNALVSQANDVAAFDGAIASLTQQVKVYEKTGARGQLGDITRQISERERLRDRLERDIVEQDAARERIIQIDALLSRIDRDLEEKNKRLDAVAGEEKKREAAKKMLEDLHGQIDAIQQEMNAIETELGGHVLFDERPHADVDDVAADEDEVGLLGVDEVHPLTELSQPVVIAQVQIAHHDHTHGLRQRFGGRQLQRLPYLVVVVDVTIDKYHHHEGENGQRGSTVVGEPTLRDEVDEAPDVEHQKQHDQIEQDDEKRVAEVVEHGGHVERQSLKCAAEVEEHTGESQQSQSEYTAFP